MQHFTHRSAAPLYSTRSQSPHASPSFINLSSSIDVFEPSRPLFSVCQLAHNKVPVTSQGQVCSKPCKRSASGDNLILETWQHGKAVSGFCILSHLPWTKSPLLLGWDFVWIVFEAGEPRTEWNGFVKFFFFWANRIFRITCCSLPSSQVFFFLKFLFPLKNTKNKLWH